MMALFAGYALFMAGFEQAGVSLNLFAERYTHCQLFGWQIPPGTFQAVTPLFVILFAPVFATLWLALGRRGQDPHPLSKFAVGLGLLGSGVCGDGTRIELRAEGRTGLTRTAHRDLLDSRMGRPLPVARGLVLHVATRSHAPGRPGAPRLLPRDRARQQFRQPAIGLVRPRKHPRDPATLSHAHHSGLGGRTHLVGT